MKCPDCTPTRGRKCAEHRRWDHAIDVLLNSGLLLPHMEDFWAFVHGKLTYAEFADRAPS